jgi:hypothetical protein
VEFVELWKVERIKEVNRLLGRLGQAAQEISSGCTRAFIGNGNNKHELIFLDKEIF